LVKGAGASVGSSNSPRAARTAAAALLACCLAGCAATLHFVDATPLCDRLADLEPGVTTQAEVRALLGTPWFAAEAWGAEIHVGQMVYQDIVVIGLPVAAGKSVRPASLLVVYDANGVLSGAQYQGEGRYDCHGGWRRGDLRGLEVQALDLLLSPPLPDGDPSLHQAEPGRCLLVVEVPARTLVVPSRTWLYLDGRFLQRAPAADPAGVFRLQLEPGTHSLACRSVRLEPEALPRPGHALLPDSGRSTSVERLDLDCPSGAARAVRVVKRPLGWALFERCGLELLDAVEDLSGAREVIVTAPP